MDAEVERSDAAAGRAVMVRDVSVWAGGTQGTRKLLSGIDLDIAQGQFVAIIGASGSGKSTLLKCLAGLIAPATGEIRLAGAPVQALRESLPLAVGFLPQFGAFHEKLTVEENLRYAAELRLPASVDAATRAGWIGHIVELGGVGGFMGQECESLSGGQRRRMALTEELIGDPAFLFLDELTSGLDVVAEEGLMASLRALAHDMHKTVVLVTHAVDHLEYCDRIILLHEGMLAASGNLTSLLDEHGAASIREMLAQYEKGHSHSEVGDMTERGDDDATAEEVRTVRSRKPPSGWRQFPILLGRQLKLLAREPGQLAIQAALIVLFPLVVAVFAMDGLPEIVSRSLRLETNPLHLAQEQFTYTVQAFSTATLVSGLAMFQVILLALSGANNGSREIARERDILEKELRVGLSPLAYVGCKVAQVTGFSALQAVAMASAVKAICHFPGSWAMQFAILFLTTLAMSCICLAISSAARSPERASLLSIYLVGFQLPLSGAVLALPGWLASLCRPFITAYWGWSAYLHTLAGTRYYDIVTASSRTVVADYASAAEMLVAQIALAVLAAWYFCDARRRPRFGRG